jgi:hypothetical protein
MPVKMLPPPKLEWPAHLPPLGGGPPLNDKPRNWRPTTNAMRRELRAIRIPRPRRTLPWQERRRIYLERKGITE